MKMSHEHIKLNDELVELFQMLHYCRPAGSKTEKKFIQRFIDPLGVDIDQAGNRYKQIGDVPILWSCHTDTVHDKAGYQSISIKEATVSLSSNSMSRCLGADDTTGCWIMRQMILNNVPGLYVFHRGEEIGGVGSSHISRNNPQFLYGIEAAIAFDRMGFSDVLTHQVTRCCSDVFAESLAEQLDLGYEISDMGIFTDTANYIDIVGECTNISVGYAHQHSKNETQNLLFASYVLQSVMNLDYTKLSFNRMPGEVDPEDGIVLSWAGYADAYDCNKNGYDDALEQLVKEHPDVAARVLEEFGFSYSDMIGEVWESSGVLDIDWVKKVG